MMFYPAFLVTAYADFIPVNGSVAKIGENHTRNIDFNVYNTLYSCNTSTIVLEENMIEPCFIGLIALPLLYCV